MRSTPPRACSSAVSLTSVPKIWIPAAGTDSPKYSRRAMATEYLLATRTSRHPDPEQLFTRQAFTTGNTYRRSASKESDRGRTPSRESGNPGRAASSPGSSSINLQYRQRHRSVGASAPLEPTRHGRSFVMREVHAVHGAETVEDMPKRRLIRIGFGQRRSAVWMPPARTSRWPRRTSSWAISLGRNTRSMQPVSMACRGMSEKRAVSGLCASVSPPACLTAWTPDDPSESPPESTTAIAYRQRHRPVT